MGVVELLNQAKQDFKDLFIRCADCKYSMFSDFELECRKGILGIANSDSGCIFGEKRDKMKHDEKEFLNEVTKMKKELNDYYKVTIKDNEIVNIELLEREAGKIKHLEKIISCQRETIETQRKTIETIKRVNGILTEPAHEKEIEIRGVNNLIRDLVNYSTCDMSMNRMYINIDEWHEIIKKHTR